MKLKFILIFMVMIVMGLTACSSESKEDENASSEDGEIPEGDPIAGIVGEYEGNTIAVRTLEDDMLYHFSMENVPILKGFSTENAQAAEGDFQIATGDKVEVSYQSLLDDEMNPIKAVKIVVITVE